MIYLYFIISFLASVLGAVCGIGGGIIIKPVLDVTNTLGVQEISFLSGCTVLSMAIISVCKAIRSKDRQLDVKMGTPIAVGAAIGGILGKELFQSIFLLCSDETIVGAVQASALGVITIGTLIYTHVKTKIQTVRLKKIGACVLIGLILGLLSSFLGIGGGPINLVVLAFFFSIERRQAAAHSLHIIVYSQSAALLSALIKGDIPKVNPLLWFVMVAGGILGGLVGARMNTTISEANVNKLFSGLMILIIAISIYNTIKFLL